MNRGPDDDDVINLQTGDGKIYQVLYKDIKTSGTINNVIEDVGVDQPIPIPGIDGKILTSVIDCCKTIETDHDGWVSKLAAMPKEEVYKLISASNYLGIAQLLDMTTNTIANLIKGKTPEQLRTIFDITRNATPEEEAEMKEEWNMEN